MHIGDQSVSVCCARSAERANVNGPGVCVQTSSETCRERGLRTHARGQAGTCGRAFRRLTAGSQQWRVRTIGGYAEAAEALPACAWGLSFTRANSRYACSEIGGTRRGRTGGHDRARQLQRLEGKRTECMTPVDDIETAASCHDRWDGFASGASTWLTPPPPQASEDPPGRSSSLRMCTKFKGNFVLNVTLMRTSRLAGHRASTSYSGSRPHAHARGRYRCHGRGAQHLGLRAACADTTPSGCC